MHRTRILLLIAVTAIAVLALTTVAAARPTNRPPAPGQGNGNAGGHGNGNAGNAAGGNTGDGGDAGSGGATSDGGNGAPDAGPVSSPAPGGAADRDGAPGNGDGPDSGKGGGVDDGTGADTGGKGNGGDKGKGAAPGNPSKGAPDDNPGKGSDNAKGDTPDAAKGQSGDRPKGPSGDKQKGKPVGNANGNRGRGPLDSSCLAVGGAPTIPAIFSPDPAWAFDDFGAKTLSADATPAALVAANADRTSTSCNRTRDGSAYWTPALYADGVRIPATRIDATYRPARGITGRRSSVPVGFVARIDSANDEGSITFRCGDEGEPSAGPAVCATDDLIATVRLPSCWDGVTPDPAMQLWNVAPVVGGKCPEGYPVAIPRMTFAIHYDTSGVVPVDAGAGIKWSLATGEVSTFSVGYMNGWDQDAIRRLGDHPAKPVKPAKPSRKPSRP